MKCQKCDEKASFHITDIVDGRTKEVHLCDKHASEYLHQNPGHGACAIPEEPRFDPIEDSEDLEYEGEEKERRMNDADLKDLTEELGDSDSDFCECCQVNFLEFRKTGMFGCENDYNVFRNRLESLFLTIHGAAKHMGKYPKSRQSGSADLGAQLVKLRNEMEKAIEIEDYESATKYRDQIKALTAKIG